MTPLTLAEQNAALASCGCDYRIGDLIRLATGGTVTWRVESVRVFHAFDVSLYPAPPYWSVSAVSVGEEGFARVHFIVPCCDRYTKVETP